MIVVPTTDEVLDLARRVRDEGGRAWIVGGTVRDALLGRAVGDLDLEVHGLEAPVLEALLRRAGRVRPVGRSFGVFRFKARPGGETIEVSLPRARGTGGAHVVVSGEPHLGIAEAARRRDLTVNAMAWDPLAGELADPCGGRADLARGLLRMCDPDTFGDDPLRAWRAAAFAARLGFSLDPALVARCRDLDVSGLPAERLREELHEVLRAPEPSRGLRAARAMDLLARTLPELHGLDTDEAVDRARGLADMVGPAPRDLALSYGALLHRGTPALATSLFERLDLRSLGRFPLRAQVVEAVACWRDLVAPASDSALRSLAERVELALAVGVALAATGVEASRDNLVRARRLGVAQGPLPALVQGRDLEALGVPPGPRMGWLLGQVRQAQLAGLVSDAAAATALVERLCDSGGGPARDAGIIAERSGPGADSPGGEGGLPPAPPDGCDKD